MEVSLRRAASHLSVLVLALAATLAAQEAAPAYRLRLLTRQSDQPVAGVEIRIDGTAAVTSDDRGVLPPAFAPRQAVRLVAPGHAPVEFRLPRRVPEAEQVLVVRLPPAAVIRGRVNEAQGLPIAGAKVRVRVPHNVIRDDHSDPPGLTVRVDRSFETVSDAAGRYRLEGLPAGGDLIVEAQPPGDRPRIRHGRSHRLRPGESRFVLLHPPEGFTICGCVTDTQGRAVPFARVRLQPLVLARRTPGRGPRDAETDAEGRFRFADVELPGSLRDDPEFDLEVCGTRRSRRAGFEFPRKDFCATAAKPGGSVEVKIRVVCGLFVTGRVVGHDNNPLRGVPVWCFGSTDASGLTGSDGTFRLGPFAPGDYHVRVNGYRVDLAGRPRPVGDAVPAKAGGEPLTIAVPAPGGFDGRLIDAATGKPLAAGRVFPALVLKPGESVSILGRETEFEGGTVRARGLPPGTYHIVAGDRSRTRGTILKGVRLVSGEIASGLEFRCRPGGRLNLKCHPGWQGYKDAYVVLEGPDGCWTGGEDFDALRPRPINSLAGEIRVRLMARRHVDGDRVSGWATRVVVPSGGEVQIDVPEPPQGIAWLWKK